MANEINRYELLQSIRQRNRDYENYSAPYADAAEYTRIMSNLPSDTAPDNYDAIKHTYYAYNDWQKNRHSIRKDEALGRYAKADADEKTILGLQQYLKTNDEQYKSFYDDVRNDRLNDGALNSQLNEALLANDFNKVDEIIAQQLAPVSQEDVEKNWMQKALESPFSYLSIGNKFLGMVGDYFFGEPETIAGKKTLALSEANIEQDEVDYHQSKLTNDWYNTKSQTTEIDFGNIDTYLYRLPGIMGSSAGTAEEDLTTMIVTAAAYRIPVAGKLIAAGTNILGNLYSRDKESNAEAYSNFKSSVFDELDEDNKKAVLDDARSYMKKSGQYTQEQIDNEDYVQDLILTKQVPVGNISLDQLEHKHSKGIKSVYMDNMALSTFDIVQTAAELAPLGLGQIAKYKRSIGNTVDKARKAINKAKDVATLGRLRRSISNRIDDVLKFGIDKASKLPTYNLRRKIKEGINRLLITSTLEGVEEGTQYIIGDKYSKGDYDIDAGYLERWLRNTTTGVRSLYAALTPFDPVYSNDKEFMENFKSGVLLGGIMGSPAIATTTATDARRQYKADQMVAGLYAENLEAKDRMRKNMLYAEQTLRGNNSLLDESFDALASLNIEDVTQSEIQQERDQYSKIANMVTSNSMQERAKKLGIDPRTKQYAAYVSLLDYHSNKAKDTADNAQKYANEYDTLLNSKEFDDYVRNTILPKVKNIDKYTSEEKEQAVSNIKNIIRHKYELQIEQELKDFYSKSKEHAEKITAELGIESNKADIVSFEEAVTQIAEQNQENITKGQQEYQNYVEMLKLAGLSDEDLDIPTMHQELKDAYEKKILTEIDANRAKQDNDIINSKDSKQVKSKVDLFLIQDALSTKFAQDIEDQATGRKAARENETVEETVEPAPYEEGSQVTTPPIPDDQEIAERDAQRNQQQSQQTQPESQPQEQPQQEQPEQQQPTQDTKTDQQQNAEFNPFFELQGDNVPILKGDNKFGQLYSRATKAANKVFRSQDDTTNPESDYSKVKSLQSQLESELLENGDSEKAEQLYKQLENLVTLIELQDLNPVYTVTKPDGTVFNYYIHAQQNGSIKRIRMIRVKNGSDISISEKPIPLLKDLQIIDEDFEIKNGTFVSKTETSKPPRKIVRIKELRKDVTTGKCAVTLMVKVGNTSGTSLLEYPATMPQGLFEHIFEQREISLKYIQPNQEQVDANNEQAQTNLNRIEQEKQQENQKELDSVIPTDQNDGTPVTPQKEVESKPTKVEDTEEEIPTFESLLEGLAPTEEPATEPTIEQPQQTDQTDSTVQQPLEYDPRKDYFSHELNYRLTRQGIPLKYQSMEEFLNNEEFSKLSTDPDFFKAAQQNGYFTVREYKRENGTIDDAIYFIIPYKGENYIAAIYSQDGLQSVFNHMTRRPLSFETQQKIMSNLVALRSKILSLWKQVEKNPNLQIVPVNLSTTSGRFVNQKNPDGSPINRPLTESKHLAIKDPYQITPYNTQIGISTGTRALQVIRYKDTVLSTNGRQLGQPQWRITVTKPDGTTDSKIVKLNYANFKGNRKMAELILDLALEDNQFYTDAAGNQIEINPLDLLQFLVNFGTHTIVNQSDTRMDPEQIRRLLEKQFYKDENGNLILGTRTYSQIDLLSNEQIRESALQYIMDNFHWAIDEQGLSTYYLGGNTQSQVKDPRFNSVWAFLKNSSVDKIVLIPGELEFTLKDFGLTKDAQGRKIVDESLPNGISELGWYIKQGILLTDVSDNFEDAKWYVQDVALVDKSAKETVQEVDKKIDQMNETLDQSQSNDQLIVPGENGEDVVIDINDIFATLDGKKRKGPNMTVEAEDSSLLINSDETINPEQSSDWLEKTLGITPEITHTVIDTLESGASVVGRVTEDSILLYENAPKGAQFHEAWHRVSQLLISEKQRRKLYDKYNKRNNTNLSDSQIDEILAEQFRDFMLNDSQHYNFETKNWFRRILDFIRLWIRTGSYGLASLYNGINRGRYKNIQPSAENVARFRQIYGEVGPNMEVMGYTFKNIATTKQLDDISNSLTYALFRVAFDKGYTMDLQDVRRMSNSIDRLKLTLEASLNKAKLSGNTPSPVIDEIVEQWDRVFVPILQSKLRNLGIRAIDKDESSTISNIEEGSERANIGQHTTEGYNISISDNAPAEVKFFFQTIPAYEIGTDGKPRAKRDPITGFNTFVDSKKSWTNVLKDLHGCRSIKNIVAKVYSLAKQGDPYYQALLFRLNDLINRSTTENEREAMQAEAMLTKISTVLTSDINNFVTVKTQRDENGNVQMRLVDNSVDIKAVRYPKLWSYILFTASGLFKQDSEGNVKSSLDAKKGLKTVIDNLNNIRTAFINNKGILKLKDKEVDLHVPANLEVAKDFIVRQLNQVGISIDKDTLNRVLTSGDFGSIINDSYTLLNNFVTNTNKFGNLAKIIDVLERVRKAINEDGTVRDIVVNDQTVKPSEVWNNIGIIKYLANYYAQAHATESSLSSLGPDGNYYYQVSQNNFTKDRIDELNNDKEVVDQLSSVVYNQGSLLLQAAKSGKKLGIETFVNFKDDTSYDTGRDYFKITDREDYSAKLTATLNNRLVFPTVADKKTYHFITGVALPHDAVSFNVTDRGTFIRYGSNALDILLGYCRDELNQIELCLRQIDDDPNHVKVIDGQTVHVNADGTINKDWIEPSRRIKNFHTPNEVTWKDSKGIEHTRTIEGNGARFLLLTGINTVVTNEKTGKKEHRFISFNDPMKSAEENLQTAKQYFFDTSVDMQRQMLSTVINGLVKQEVSTAIELGLIEGNPNSIGTLRNKLLDQNILEQRKQRYAQYGANAEGFAIFDILSDYTINSIISINEVEKVFSGSPAYYKVKYNENGVEDMAVDKIKRLGSLTSTGLNNRLDFTTNPLDTDEYTVAELKDHEIRDKQYAVLKDLFTRGNIKETIQELEGQDAWEEVKDLSIKEIQQKYPEAVKIAKLAAKREVSGYKSGVNVADAAVYISPRMAENLLRMRGVWSKDIKDAFDILSNPETADKWESDPELYAKANKVVLNAMKYVAFGNRFDIPGLSIPYFNKMALFPLFKSIATGDIRALYDRMTQPGNEIDMVMFNSAVKAGSVNPTKYYRQATDSEIELKDGQTVLSAELTENLTDDQEFRVSNLNELVTYKQKYKYIRQQLETNPHTHEDQMVGTQFMKVNLSNLRDTDMYGREGEQVSGSDIKRTVMDTLNKLSDIGVDEIKELVFDGDAVDIDKLVKLIADDARESGANDNIMSALRVENGKLIIPLDALSDNKWLESRFLAMLDKAIVDVNLPGGAFIQRSAFGLEATGQDVITENMINDGKPLLMINDDNSMDSVVSINMFKHFIPNYSKMTFREARQWLLDHNIIGKNAKANAIGYRIPTQSVASISALRFVDVLPEIMGDTIVLPEGFTKLTGSDFDIDKLYVARLAYNENGEIVSHDNIEQNNIQQLKRAYGNDLLNAYMKVLLTKDNTSSLKLSIDVATDNVKAVLKDIESNQQGNPKPFEVYTPTYQEARKAEYTGGKAGIGPFALNNAHHILSQLTGLKMASNDFTEALGITDVSRIYDTPTVGTPKGGRILDWLSAMINAFVDIAKDPYITRLNVNAYTYNMTSFLLRTGKGKWTFYFMSQPILKDIANEVLKTKGKYGVDQTKSASQLEQEAIDKVLDKYDPTGNIRKQYQRINRDNRLAGIEYKNIFEPVLTERGVETTLARAVLKGESAEDFNTVQIKMWYAFQMLKPYADSLANLVKYSKIDTKKTGKSFAERNMYYSAMQAIQSDPNFEEGAVSRFFDETFIRHKTDNDILLGNQIFSNLLMRSTQSFNDQLYQILSLLGRNTTADSTLLKTTINAMESQIKANFFNEFAQKNNIDVKSMFKGRLSMAKRLNNFKQLILRRDPRVAHLIDNTGTITNDFINFLLPNINNTPDNPDGLDFIDTSEMLNTDEASANNLINYWRELIEDPNPQVSKLFKDLVVYAFITSGDNATMNSFFQYVPNSYRNEIGYTEYVQQQLEQLVNGSTLGYQTKEDIFLNNWFNDKLVKPVRLVESDHFLKGLYDKKDATYPILLSGQRDNNKDGIKPVGYVTDTFGDKHPIFPPYIKIKDGAGNTPANQHVYQLIGYYYVTENNRQVAKPVYALVSKKGYRYKGHTVTEYGVKTQFDFNKEREFDASNVLNNKHTVNPNFPFADFWNSIYIQPINSLYSYENNQISMDDVVWNEDQFEQSTVENDIEQLNDVNNEQTINIYAGTNENSDLSNLAIRPFTHLGTQFQSVEQAFQFYKSEFSPKNEYNQAISQAIMTTTSGRELRRLGRSFKGLDQNAWDQMAPTIMKQLILDSFTQNPEAAQRLLSTGNSVLTHTQDNSRWGTEFPRILMEVRNELRSDQQSSSFTFDEFVLQNQGNNIDDYVLHSGGAIGSDSVWGQIAEEYGIPNTPDRQMHYYNNQPTPKGNVQISAEDYEEGRYKVAEAAKANWGYQYKTMKDDRLIRNWSQVKYSDAIYAIGTMVKEGERIFPNQPGDTRTAKHTAVTGGTGYAVEMAIQAGKPVYVFDQSRNRWFKNINGEWSVSEVPTLTPNFAGIGTRQIQQNGIDAIRSVFNKTFSNREVNSQQTVQSMDDLVNDNQQGHSFTDELAELGKKRKEQCK